MTSGGAQETPRKAERKHEKGKKNEKEDKRGGPGSGSGAKTQKLSAKSGAAHKSTRIAAIKAENKSTPGSANKDTI